MTDREPFEVAECPAVKPLDYVRFHAFIDKITTRITGKSGTTERKVSIVVPRGGAGQVLRINRGRVRAVPPRFRELLDERELKTLTFSVARIDAGPGLGIVTAVLNGAEITGIQEQLL